MVAVRIGTVDVWILEVFPIATPAFGDKETKTVLNLEFSRDNCENSKGFWPRLFMKISAARRLMSSQHELMDNASHSVIIFKS